MSKETIKLEIINLEEEIKKVNEQINYYKSEIQYRNALMKNKVEYHKNFRLVKDREDEIRILDRKITELEKKIVDRKKLL
jgi:peptidoglycan hydrolase CwlO-like protein